MFSRTILRPEIDQNDEKCGVNVAKKSFRRQKGHGRGNDESGGAVPIFLEIRTEAHSGGITRLSLSFTISFATAAGASGLRSCRAVGVARE